MLNIHYGHMWHFHLFSLSLFDLKKEDRKQPKRNCFHLLKYTNILNLCTSYDAYILYEEIFSSLSLKWHLESESFRHSEGDVSMYMINSSITPITTTKSNNHHSKSHMCLPLLLFQFECYFKALMRYFDYWSCYVSKAAADFGRNFFRLEMIG